MIEFMTLFWGLEEWGVAFEFVFFGLVPEWVFGGRKFFYFFLNLVRRRVKVFWGWDDRGLWE